MRNRLEEGPEIMGNNKTADKKFGWRLLPRKMDTSNPPRPRFTAHYRSAIAAHVIAVTASVVATTGAAQASAVITTNTWTGGGGNSFWSNLYNWYLNAAPSNGSTVTIGSPATTAAPAVDDYSVTPPTLSALTIDPDSGMAVAAGVDLLIGAGGYVNDNGRITLNSSAANANTGLGIDGTMTLEGTGNLILNAVPGGSLFTATIYGGNTLTQNSGHTISGTGQINVASFTNNGTVNANSNGNNLLLQYSISGTFVNNGTFEATNGGTLTFGSGPFINTGTILADAGTVVLNGYTNLTNSGTMQADTGGSLEENSATINNAGGTIEANGGTVLINGGSVTGGTLASTSGSEIDEQGVTRLPNVTLSAGSNLYVLDGSHIYFIAGGGTSVTTTNNGTITINKGGTNANTSIGIGGTVELAGSGSIVLNGFAGNWESAWINDLGNSNLIQDSRHSISGAGLINVDSFTNNGTVNADISGSTLLLETNGLAYTNSGTYEATNGGTLAVTSVANFAAGTLTGGTYQVNANSTMILPGNITTNAATIILNGTNTTFSAISAMTGNTGIFKLENGATFTTTGNFTNSGTLSLDPSTLDVTGNLVLNGSSIVAIGLSGTQAGQYDTIHVTGSATLAGTLSLNLGNGFTASVGDSFNFITAGGGITGTFTNAGPIDVNGYVFDLTNTSNGLGLQVAAVPEPAALALLAIGGLGFLLIRKRAGVRY